MQCKNVSLVSSRLYNPVLWRLSRCHGGSSLLYSLREDASPPAVYGAELLHPLLCTSKDPEELGPKLPLQLGNKLHLCKGAVKVGSSIASLPFKTLSKTWEQNPPVLLSALLRYAAALKQQSKRSCILPSMLLGFFLQPCQPYRAQEGSRF